MTNDLTTAQARNLESLRAHGSVTYTTNQTLKKGAMRGTWEKASAKGFNQTALYGLVSAGLVLHTVTETETETSLRRLRTFRLA